MAGLLALLAIVHSAMIGPLIYATPYNKVDFTGFRGLLKV